MNAPHRFPAALHRTPTANGETVTAADGLADPDEFFLTAHVSRDGHIVGIDHPMDADWYDVRTAHIALRDRINERLDTQDRCPFKPEPADPDELHEAAREEALAEFVEWQRADYERREFEDFGNWLANKARWNRPNRYEVALTAAEGGARMTRAELVALSVNQRKFGRENRRAGGR